MSFSLKSTTPEFSRRQKDVFDQLKVLENNRKNTLSNDDNQMETDEAPEQPIRSNKRAQRSVTRHFRGKESIFKKPQNPAPGKFFNRMPDFKKNPHKWTKYSLEDVRDEDISERSNTDAALSFLRQLEVRRNKESHNDESDGPDELPKKIVFKQRTPVDPRRAEQESETSQPTFRNSKIVMPEYVVGQKVKKDKKAKSINNATKGNELKLDHLFDDDENSNNAEDEAGV